MTACGILFRTKIKQVGLVEDLMRAWVYICQRSKGKILRASDERAGCHATQSKWFLLAFDSKI